MANHLLGRAYLIEGEVIRGQGLGRDALVPTLNLTISHYQLPKAGVYATYTKIAKVWVPSVSFIGHRLSTDGNFAIETHIIDTEIETPPLGYVGIRFVAYLRKNRTFSHLDALKAQIIKDIASAKKVFVWKIPYFKNP